MEVELVDVSVAAHLAKSGNPQPNQIPMKAMTARVTMRRIIILILLQIIIFLSFLA